MLFADTFAFLEVRRNGEWGRKYYWFVCPPDQFMYFTQDDEPTYNQFKDALAPLVRKKKVKFGVISHYLFGSDLESYCVEQSASSGSQAEAGSDSALGRPLRQEAVYALDVARASFNILRFLLFGGIAQERITGINPPAIKTLFFSDASKLPLPWLRMYHQLMAQKSEGIYKVVAKYSGETEHFTKQEIMEKARVERRALWAEVKKISGDENYKLIRTDVLAQYGTPCDYCGATETKVKYCSRCQAEGHCGVECQKLAWPAHKKKCLDAELTRAFARWATTNPIHR